MKKVVMGIIPSRMEAGAMIQHLKDTHISENQISYVYRNTEGNVETVGTTPATPGEGAATGAVVGGTVGALAGLATAIGVIPVIGPIFAAGPLIAALGITTAGAVGATAVAAATGAMAGTLIGALVNLGATDTDAKVYEERVLAGDTLIIVETENDEEVKRMFAQHGATDIRTYETQ